MLVNLDQAREQKNSPLENQKSDDSLNVLVKDGKIYAPVSFLSDEFGYASDHITRLARQNKVQAICQEKRWYVTRDSLVAYREQAKQNKIQGGLKSTSVISGHLQKKISAQPVSSPEDDCIVLSNTGLSDKQDKTEGESETVLSFGNTQKEQLTSKNSLTLGEYLSKARTTEIFKRVTHRLENSLLKTAGRALITSAVFLILIFNAILGMKISNVNGLSANFLNTAFCKIISLPFIPDLMNCRSNSDNSNSVDNELPIDSPSVSQTPNSSPPPSRFKINQLLNKKLTRHPLPRWRYSKILLMP